MGGLGGCPYAPGARGNLGTGSLVGYLENKGYDTGVDLFRLKRAEDFLASLDFTKNIGDRDMTADFNTIRLETDDQGVAWLTLNRPDKHHAFNAEMIAELTEAADHIRRHQAIRLVVIKADGPSFCAAEIWPG